MRVHVSHVALLFNLWACGGNLTSTDTPAPANSKTPTFTDIQSAILNVYCISCHSADLSSYDEVSDYVTAGDSAGSQLYQKVASGDMPLGGPALSSDLQAKLQTWIDAGAKND